MVIVTEIPNFSGWNGALSDLPVELLSEIFLRLPVRSLLTCQCVCKSFDELIRSPTFIASHVNQNSTSSTNTYCSVNILAIDEDFKDRCEQILINTEGDNVISTWHVRQSNPLTNQISVIGSCNGLFCASLDISGEPRGSRIMLWNPVTRENRFLPKPKIDARSGQFSPVNAFGFVPESNEYKVVRFISYYTLDSQDLPSPGTVFVMQIEVYKMSTDSWTVLNANTTPCSGPGHMSLEIESFLPLRIDHHQPSRTLFLKGAFHWLAINPKNVYDPCAAVVAFDLEHEELKLISLPGPDRILHAHTCQLEIINNLLGLIVPGRPGAFSPDFDIWVMYEYGSRESWTKKYRVEQSTGLARPCGYWRDDLLLMVEDGREDDRKDGRKNSLFFYNLNTQERRNILESGHFYYDHFCSYVETLVPVSKRNAISENADE